MNNTLEKIDMKACISDNALDIQDKIDIKDCCKDPKNLAQITATMKRCMVCKCRHFEFEATPFNVFTKVS